MGFNWGFVYLSTYRGLSIDRDHPLQREIKIIEIEVEIL